MNKYMLLCFLEGYRTLISYLKDGADLEDTLEHTRLLVENELLPENALYLFELSQGKPLLLRKLFQTQVLSIKDNLLTLGEVV